ncbi:phage integrase N-terminal SAM-like domain-containing protein [Methylolobus aquaticus]
MDSFLGDLGRRGNLKDWQFRQMADALQKLFELVGVDWLGEVDWRHWRDSARNLEGTHPPAARDYAMPAAPSAPNPTPFDALRGKHAALLDQVRAAIRRRGFSIKTEQTYLHWTLRFLGFLGDRDPRVGQASDIARFLDELAVHRRV